MFFLWVFFEPSKIYYTIVCSSKLEKRIKEGVFGFTIGELCCCPKLLNFIGQSMADALLCIILCVFVRMVFYNRCLDLILLSCICVYLCLTPFYGWSSFGCVCRLLEPLYKVTNFNGQWILWRRAGSALWYPDWDISWNFNRHWKSETLFQLIIHLCYVPGVLSFVILFILTCLCVNHVPMCMHVHLSFDQ